MVPLLVSERSTDTPPTNESSGPSGGRARRLFLSLPFQIVVAAALGIVIGTLAPAGSLKPLSEAGKTVIHWVKIVAGPFLFLTILASVAQVKLQWGQGLRLVAIALLNTSIAIAIGIAFGFTLLKDVRLPTLTAAGSAAATTPTLGISTWLKTFTPPSLLEPFVRNEILFIALLALVLGIAVRKAWGRGADGDDRLAAFARKVEAIREIPGILLLWIFRIIPLAVLCVVAAAVSEHRAEVFASLGRFIAASVGGMVAHVCIVYVAWVMIGRIGVRRFAREAREPVLYALGVNSSLATLPLTLRALKRLGVSDRSASLGAGVATNLNNDGIVLYEAQAAFFIALVHGIPIGPPQMIIIALTCIVASMGITGIPEAGFISLSVVVSTLGFPTDVLPLLLAVDWVIARLRSGVNVLSDMTLAIALDATEKHPVPSAGTSRDTAAHGPF